MLKAGNRTEIGFRIKWITHTDMFNTLQNLFFKFCFQCQRHKYASTVGTHLTGTIEIGHHGNIGRQIQIGIFTDNQRRLTAQLHRDFFQARICSLRHDLFAGRNATGKRHFGNIRMRSQITTNFTTAGNHIKDTMRHTCFSINFCQF